MLNWSLIRRSVAIPPLRFGSRAVRAIPHPEKRHKGGEDAFISDDYIVAVADGVGGYASSGVNPAVFTRRVMHHTLGHAQKQIGGKAQHALDAGLKHTLAERVVGGCPATVATIMNCSGQPGNAEIDILNLGDCGTILFRKDYALYKTTVQQHYFNCPFQLPDDAPSRGITATITLEPGDIVLQASDGVFDNVFEDRILEMMLKICRKQQSTESAAEELATLATMLGADRKHRSPFAVSAASAGYRFLGGKQDDVTVLLSVIEQTPNDFVTPPSFTTPCLITDIFPE